MKFIPLTPVKMRSSYQAGPAKLTITDTVVRFSSEAVKMLPEAATGVDAMIDRDAKKILLVPGKGFALNRHKSFRQITMAGKQFQATTGLPMGDYLVTAYNEDGRHGLLISIP